MCFQINRGGMKVRKIIGIAAGIALFSAAATAAAAEIDWNSTYSQGLERAKEENKNLFILITAPTWCGPCKWMEANTFKDEEVISLINREFIAVRVLDMVNGKRNPDLKLFDFSGFPAVFVYNQEGEPLTSSVGAVDAETLVKRTEGYTDPNYDPANHFLSFSWQEGSFDQVELDVWEEKRNGRTYTYQEVKRDDFIYLYDDRRGLYLALPVGGGKAFSSDDNGESWEPMGEIRLD